MGEGMGQQSRLPSKKGELLLGFRDLNRVCLYLTTKVKGIWKIPSPFPNLNIFFFPLETAKPRILS